MVAGSTRVKPADFPFSCNSTGSRSDRFQEHDSFADDYRYWVEHAFQVKGCSYMSCWCSWDAAFPSLTAFSATKRINVSTSYADCSFFAATWALHDDDSFWDFSCSSSSRSIADLTASTVKETPLIPCCSQ